MIYFLEIFYRKSFIPSLRDARDDGGPVSTDILSLQDNGFVWEFPFTYIPSLRDAGITGVAVSTDILSLRDNGFV